MQNKNLKFTLLIFLISLAGMFFPVLRSQAANQINITSYVIQKDGNAMLDGSYDIRFAVYSKDRTSIDPYPSNSDAGSRVWYENQTVDIYDGVLSAYLGAKTPFPDNIDFNTGDYYLGIQIGNDSEMAPRKKLGAAISSINSSYLQGHTVGTAVGNVPLVTKNGLDSKILAQISEVGTVSSGTWEGDVIDDSFIASDLTDKTYNGLTITTSTNKFVISNSTTNNLTLENGVLSLSQMGGAGSVVYSNGTSFGFSAVGTDGQVLTSTGTGTPIWADVSGLGIGNAVTDGTAGSLLFVDADGNLGQNNANFFWDNVNNELGIGTITPTSQLNIFGSTGDTEGIKIQPNGWPYYTRMGHIGTSGSEFFISSNYNHESGTVDSNVYGTSYVGLSVTNWGGGFLTFGTGDNNTAPSERMRINDNGYVGIGTATPASILEVAGLGTFDSLAITNELYDSSSSAGDDGMILKSTGSGTQWVTPSDLGLGGSAGIGNAITDGTVGSVLFVDADGKLAQNNDAFYWDNNSESLGIGTNTPTSLLHLGAGTSAAGTAPLKFTSGTLLTTPEAGAIEFNGSDYYASIEGTAGYTSQYPPEQSNTYVKATSTYTAGPYTFHSYQATNPSNPLTGSIYTRVWVANSATNQRFHIDLGEAKTIERIYYENYYGTEAATPTIGVQNFTFWGSNDADAFADLTYGDNTNWTQLTTSQSTFDAHVDADQADPKYITVTNSTAYRYYAFKFADNYGYPLMAVNRIELQTYDPGYGFRKGIVLNNGTNLISGRIPFATTNGRLTDSANLNWGSSTLSITGQLDITGNTYLATDSGNVGIGTADPETKLDIVGGDIAIGNNQFYQARNSVGSLTNLFGLNSSDMFWLGGEFDNEMRIQNGGATSQNNVMTFYVKGDERMRITNTGNVGIGNSDPNYTLDVTGDINFSGDLYQDGVLFNSGTSSQWDNSGDNIYYNDGNVGIGTNSPGAKLAVDAATDPCTGGAETTDGDYIIRTFKADDTLECSEAVNAEVLVVAGGGGGWGGGGGAGGVIYDTDFPIPADSYPISVGEGGAKYGNNGEDSVLSSLTAFGGGHGGGGEDGSNGGSGGGGIRQGSNNGGSGTPEQGYDGGGGSGGFTGQGAGGGAGGAGGDANGDNGGDGGVGYMSSISGSPVCYAGGGGGGGTGTPGVVSCGGGAGANWNATSGTANTGGGGGGIYGDNPGSGGSGIVIVKYHKTTSNVAATFTGGSVGIGTTTPTEMLSIGDNASYFNVTSKGDVYANQKTLDGTSTTNGTGVSSTTLILTNASDFDIGNYVEVDSTDCVTGVNVCYAKITNKVSNTLTISPAMSWATDMDVTEVHIPEIGGTNLDNTLANRFGRGYFIDGIVAGNGTTYFTDKGITSANDYSVNSDQLFIDHETGYVGIGTNTPTGILDINYNVTTTSEGNDAYTKLLLHNDDPDNSFLDDSGSAHTITAVGNVTQSATQSKWGKSLYNPGASTDRLLVPASTDFAFGTGDFTIDFWAFIQSGSGPYARLIHFSPYYWGNANTWAIVVYGGNHIGLASYRMGNPTVSSPSVNYNEWNHVALVRESGVFKLFINGHLESTNSDYTTTPMEDTATNSLSVTNTTQYSGGEEFQGYLDEVRISKGIARWTSDFTPPTEGYGNSTTTPTSGFMMSSGGNVGIGTTTPTSKLQINGTLGSLSGGLSFGDGDTGLYEKTDDNLRIQTGGSDRLTIDASGNVGIGTTSPSAKLAVVTEATEVDPCTGGTETTDGDYIIRTFTADGTLDCSSSVDAEVLLVGGGGGGGTNQGGHGGAGGGGAGGLVHEASHSVSADSYEIAVGDGGAGGATNTNGTNGRDSTFDTLTADGGGGGGGAYAASGSTGGSGGGTGQGGANNGGGDPTVNQGSKGGDSNGSNQNSGPGGGGAGGVGGDIIVGNVGGNGGVGLSYDITGSSVCYAGGGGGAKYSSGSPGSATCGGGSGNSGAGTDGLGGGGGGGEGGATGGKGGSGIVIIKYLPINENPIAATFSGGNVGIGITTPTSKLQISGTLGALSGGLSFGDGDTGLYEYTDDNFRLQTAGSDRLTINSSGNVGIGTTSPSALLQLGAGTATAGTAPIKFTSGTLLTKAEIGAIEFDGNDYFGSISVANPDTYYYPPAQNSTYVKANTYDAPSYLAYFATDPNKSVVGDYTNNSWLSNADHGRFQIDLGSATIIDKIYYENFHDSGSNLLPGVKNFTFWGTNSDTAFADTTWLDDSGMLAAGWTKITTASTVFEEHAASNQADPKTILATNTAAYRYYGFKFLDDYGWPIAGIRRLVLLKNAGNVGGRKGFVLNDGTNLVSGRIPFATTNGRLTDNASFVFDGTNVGIGTTSPGQMLTIGNGTDQGNVYIANGYICVDDNGTCGIVSPTAGSVYAVNAYTTGADYAEYFKTKDTDLKSGEAVCVDIAEDKSVKRCQNDGDNTIMGIVSTNPSIVGNRTEDQDKDPDHYKIIGMMGQVLGLVSSENGEIKVGDNLTASLIPGYMRKANAGESTVGVAMEDFKGTKGEIQILISRRNQSLTVEKVEEAVTENIKNMNVEDQVNNMIAKAQTNLDTQIDNTNQTLQQIQDSLTQTNTEVASVEALQTKIQKQMYDITELTKTASDFISTLDVSDLVYKDKLGNLNLGEGKLTVGDVEADTIKANDVVTDTLKMEDNKTSGKSLIKSGETDETILTPEASADAKIYVTPIGNTFNQVLYVDKIVDSQSFNVKINKSVDEDINFNWLIVK